MSTTTTNIESNFPTNTHEKGDKKDLIFKSLAPLAIKNALADHDQKLINLTLHWIAEWAKIEKTRKDMNEIELMSKVIQLLQAAVKGNQKDAIINGLRALANLCFDYDENRDHVLNSPGGINVLVAITKNGDPSLVLTAFKAILNISMDNELVQSEMVQQGLANRILELININPLPPFADSIHREIVVAALKVWSSLLESDAGLEALFTGSGMSVLGKCIDTMRKIMSTVVDPVQVQDYEWSLEVMDAVSVVLETICEKEPAQTKMAHSDVLQITMDYIETIPVYQTETQEEEEEEEEKQDMPNLESIKLLLAKVVSATTMSDTNMNYLVNRPEIISRFVSWMRVEGMGEKLDDEIRMSGGLCLGNIARSDETCFTLASVHNIGPALLEMVQAEALRLSKSKLNKDETKLVIKVVHAALGALKNLSLACKVRPILGDLDTITIVSKLFELDHIQPLYISIVPILKNLCNGSDSVIDRNVYKMLTGLTTTTKTTSTTLKEYLVTHTFKSSPLAKLIKVIWNSPKENDNGLRNEGGRVIVHIIKAIHRSSATQFLPVLKELNGLTLVLQILTGAHLTKPALDNHTMDHHHAHFDAPSESTRVFPLVQNESIVALALLCSMAEWVAPQIIKFKSVVPTLLKILVEMPKESSTMSGGDDEMEQDIVVGAKPTYSIQMMMNAVLLLRYLVVENGFSEKTSVKTALTKLVDSKVKADSKSVEFQFQAALGQVLSLCK